MSTASAWSVALNGIEGAMVEVEVAEGGGLPRTVLVGLPDAALSQAKERLGAAKPVVLLMQTHMGHGVSYMEGDYRWHGKPPSDEQLAAALHEIGETSLGDF